MKQNKMKQNKIRTYLTVTAGAGCAASVADGAVTLYTEGERTVSTVAGSISLTSQIFRDSKGVPLGALRDVTIDNGQSRIGRASNNRTFAQEGLDFSGVASRSSQSYYQDAYRNSDSAQGGAAIGVNYMLLDLTDGPGLHESIAKFNFDGVGGGEFLAIATNDDGTAISIAEGIALIEAGNVPEPSSLALLAIGSVGLAARRRRKAA